VRGLRLKALTICQLRPLDMRVGNSDESAANPPELHVRALRNCMAGCDHF
jgi:hypothetical protein